MSAQEFYKWQKERVKRNSKLRKERLLRAREKGTHLKSEWLDMVLFFENTCVRCLEKTFDIAKDHIIPIYQGGSDGLDNLQPLCRKCNSSKGPENIDFRSSCALFIGKTLPEQYKANSNG